MKKKPLKSIFFQNVNLGVFSEKHIHNLTSKDVDFHHDWISKTDTKYFGNGCAFAHTESHNKMLFLEQTGKYLLQKLIFKKL